MKKRKMKYMIIVLTTWLFVLLGLLNVSYADKLFISTSGSTYPDNQVVYRCEVNGPADTPIVDMIITHESFDFSHIIAFSETGEMFVTNHGFYTTPGSVSRFLDPAGSPVFNGTIPSDMLGYETQWADFREGELFIANADIGKVLRFAFDGDGNAIFNGEIEEYLGPALRGVAVNPLTGDLFVTLCCSSSRINRYIFDENGQAMLNEVITDVGLINPQGIAFSPWGELFIANHSGDNSISRFLFDAMGNTIPNGKIFGNGLALPADMDFSSWGELFVSNYSGTGGVSRFIFDESHNAIPNGSIPSLSGVRLGGLAFYPQDIKTRIKNLVDKLESLINASQLTQQQANPLATKLEQAIANLNKKKPNSTAACNKISDFMDQVNAYVNSGKLTPEEGQDLIDAAEDISSRICG